MQHSHSRHQKTTSNPLGMNLKGKLKFINEWPLEGAMYINLWKKIQGHSKFCFCNLLKIWTVSDKTVPKAFLEFILKPHVRDKRLYGTGTSGLMLIPVTHPTQCVAECAKCGFSGQANTTWGPSTDRPNDPQFNMAVRITSEHTCARNAQARIRAIYVIGLLHTEIVWDTSQSPHTIWCSPTRPHCHWDWRIGIGCAMAAERWVWANEISIFFPCRDQCLTRVLTRKILKEKRNL